MKDFEIEESEQALIYKLALHLLPGIGPVLARALVSYCGGIEDIFTMRKGLLERIPGIGKERASAIINHRSFQKAEEELAFMKNEQIKFLFYLDKQYPLRLKNCEDAPVGLFYKGNISLNEPKTLAIVGTRHMTSYGKEMTTAIVRDLQPYKVTIISGLAYGIDSVAHKEAIKNNLPTVGVMAHGLRVIYPAEHRPLAEKMQLNGGLLTEYTSKAKAEVDNFPARNRIVAGMSDAILVVESAKRGGALITADLANGYNRDVFAIPGRCGDHYSQGCNELIRQNKAALVQSAKDITDLMNWTIEDQQQPPNRFIQAELFSTLSEQEQTLLTLMKPEKQSLDNMAISTGIPIQQISSLLLKLEFAGLVKALPGKMFALSFT